MIIDILLLILRGSSGSAWSDDKVTTQLNISLSTAYFIFYISDSLCFYQISIHPLN